MLAQASAAGKLSGQFRAEQLAHERLARNSEQQWPPNVVNFLQCSKQLQIMPERFAEAYPGSNIICSDATPQSCNR